MYSVDVIYEDRISVLVDAENEHEAKSIAEEQCYLPERSMVIDIIAYNLED